MTTTVDTDREWRTRAACADFDPEWWFAPRGSSDEHMAMGICRRCPVQVSCWAEAKRLQETGCVRDGQRLPEYTSGWSYLGECGNCGREVVGKNRRWCSDICREARRERPTRQCEHCGGSYTAYSTSQRYCDTACARSASAAKRRAARDAQAAAALAADPPQLRQVDGPAARTCRRGHPLTADNTYRRSGKDRCVACREVATTSRNAVVAATQRVLLASRGELAS